MPRPKRAARRTGSRPGCCHRRRRAARGNRPHARRRHHHRRGARRGAAASRSRGLSMSEVFRRMRVRSTSAAKVRDISCSAAPGGASRAALRPARRRRSMRRWRRDRRARPAATTRKTRRLSPTPNMTRCGFGMRAHRARFPVLAGDGSISDTVGAKPSEKFAKVRHRVPMLSLSNVFADEEVREFVDRVRRFLDWPAERAAGLHGRAEDRRPLLLAALRGWPAGRGRDARRRRGGRGRHRQCPHHRARSPAS